MRKVKELRDNGLTEEALNMVVAEDMAQVDKWGHQRHSIFEWLAFTTEELGELSQAICEHHFRDGDIQQIVLEATQVATLALKIAWMVKESGGASELNAEKP